MRTVNYFKFDELSNDGKEIVTEKYKSLVNNNDLGLPTINSMVTSPFTYWLEKMFNNKVEINNKFQISGLINSIYDLLNLEIKYKIPEILTVPYLKLKNYFPLKDNYLLQLEKTDNRFSNRRVSNNQLDKVSNEKFYLLIDDISQKFFDELSDLMAKDFAEKQEFFSTSDGLSEHLSHESIYFEESTLNIRVFK